MLHTGIVTSFIIKDGKILLLRRSGRVRTMRGLWSAVSGSIEGGEEPVQRAKKEIFEEVGLKEQYITLRKSAPQMRVKSPRYENQEWEIFPFLFETSGSAISLNWENSEYKWINPDEISNYDAVPGLKEVLDCLL